MALLDPVLLKSRLGLLAGRFDVDALDECDSTNSELMRRAESGAPSGTVIVADRQTAGRGRRGRSWLSAPESSLTFSLLWRFSGPLARLSGLSLAVGVAVDAFLVRMTLVPAVLALLGERAWWLPKWLDRLLPTFDVEGEVLSTEMRSMPVRVQVPPGTLQAGSHPLVMEIRSTGEDPHQVTEKAAFIVPR